ncbi:hypothetical protein D3C78_1831310 [compost metagenome]
MDGKKLVVPMVHRLPERLPCWLAPKLCAPSSITAMPCLAAMALMASKSAHWPYRLTGMIALVRGVIAASSSAGSRL